MEKQKITVTIDSSLSREEAVSQMNEVMEHFKRQEENQENGYIYNIHIKEGEEEKDVNIAVGVKYFYSGDSEDIYFALEEADMLYDFLNDPCTDWFVMGINGIHPYINIVPMNENTDMQGITHVFACVGEAGNMLDAFEVEAVNGSKVSVRDSETDEIIEKDKWSLFYEKAY